MAFEIKFYGSKLSETDAVELSVWVNGNNEITINVNDGIDNFISLDKPTAVRLVRELKRQISEIE